jgi:hypothetical protein
MSRWLFLFAGGAMIGAGISGTWQAVAVAVGVILLHAGVEAE